MTPEAVRRYGRQLALAEFGPEAQAAVLEARVVVAGAGLCAETTARYLAAAGVGCLRLHAGAWEVPGLVDGLTASQPGVRLEPLPALLFAAGSQTGTDGITAALEDATLLVKTSFDDDPWLAAAVRAGLPAVFVRASLEGVDVLSLRRQGPCPHVPLDRPRTASSTPSASALEVVGGTLAATEALRLIGARARGEQELGPAARLLRLGVGGGPTLAQDIPWSPACFACGGRGMEMSFS